MIWIETRTQEEASHRRERMWGTNWTATPDGGLVGRTNGEGLFEGDRFWADAIKDTRDEPEQRLAMAIRNLPLPAAFREAAIALRAIIRAKRKATDLFEHRLAELHRLAAIQSLAWYDDLDIAPFSEVAALDLSPGVIGWDLLPLLNMTDRKLMAETWPTPARHATGEILYPAIKRNGAALLRAQREAQRLDWLSMLDDDDADAVTVLAPAPLAQGRGASPRVKRRGLFARLFGIGR